MYPRSEEDSAATAPARALCARCPISERCLKYATVVQEPAGIWGGLNKRERFNLRRRWRKAGVLEDIEREVQSWQ